LNPQPNLTSHYDSSVIRERPEEHGAESGALPLSIAEALPKWAEHMIDVDGTDSDYVDRKLRHVRRIAGSLGWQFVSEIEPKGLREFIDEMKQEGGRNGRGIAPMTLQNHATSIRTFAEWLSDCDELGMFGRSPLKGFKVREKGRGPGSRAFRYEEAIKLIRSALVYWSKSPHDRRPRWLFYMFLLLSGLRESETTACKFGCLDRKGSIIHVPASGSKTNTAARIYYPPELQEAMKWWKELRGEGICEQIFPSAGDFNGLIRDCKRAGIDTTRVGHHSFRKTLLTAMKAMQMQGGDNAAIMAQSRHVTENVLTNIYIDEELLPTKELFSRLPKVFPAGVRHEIEYAMKHKANAEAEDNPVKPAKAPRHSKNNPGLALINKAWPDLPKSLRDGIVSMVKIAQSCGE